MTTAIPLTLHLLVLIGAYELASGIGSLSGTLDWQKMVEEFDRSPGLTFVSGFAAFAIGAAINISHHHWTDPLAILVSAIGWIAIVEGVMIIVCPGPLLRFTRGLVRHQKLIGIAALLFGAALILLGLTGRANPIL